jgi:hypothetical protein
MFCSLTALSAESGVNVVMATHSLDMIKALEVHTKEKDGDFIAINHFTKEGGLFEFDSSNIRHNRVLNVDNFSQILLVSQISKDVFSNFIFMSLIENKLSQTTISVSFLTTT